MGAILAAFSALGEQRWFRWATWYLAAHALLAIILVLVAGFAAHDAPPTGALP